MSKLQKLFIKSESKGVIDETNKLLCGVVGSNGIIDRQGESLNPMGWDLKNFESNPVILYAHDYRSLPIGKADKVWIEKEQLMFNIKFADTQMGKDCFDLFKGGFLNAFSVGFIPKEYDTTGQYTYKTQELLELSVVPVPANPEALLGNKEMSAKMKSLETMLKEKGEVIEKQGRTLSAKNETRVREAHKQLNDMIGELENKDDEKSVEETVTLKKSELKALITESVKELLAGLKIIEEKIVEKVVEKQPEKIIEKKELEDKTLEQLKGIREGYVKTGIIAGLTIRNINSLLSIKSSTQKGGENK